MHRLWITFAMLQLACNQDPTPDGTGDMSVPRDMTGTVTRDMTRPPPMVTVPVMCEAGVITAQQLYDTVVKTSCASNNCHGGPQLPSLKSAAEIKALVGQSSFSSLPYIDSGKDINKSYLLYKLTGEQLKVPAGGGLQMPDGAPLSEQDICKFFLWVSSGAN